MEKNYLNKLAHKMDFKSQIPKEEMEWLCNKTRKINLKKNEYFLQAGEIPGYIGMNMSGLLRLFYIDSNGIEMTKHFCMENTLAMSYSAFVNQQESKFFIKAVEKTELVIFNYKIYNQLKERHQCWQIINGKLAEMLFTLIEKREAELLLNNAEERYQQFLIDYPNLDSRLPQYHIASYLGIKPESLSRIRAKFKNNKKA